MSTIVVAIQSAGPLSMLDEFYQNIYHQVIEESARTYLHALGLSSRIEGLTIDHETWVDLFKIAFDVASSCTLTNPEQLDSTTTLAENKDRTKIVEMIPLLSIEGNQCWIERSRIPKLITLELMLDNLSRSTRH